MENLFIDNASDKELIRKEKNTFLDRIIKDLMNAYTGIHKDEQHSHGISLFYIGCHPNRNCVHSFLVDRNNNIKFRSDSELIYKDELDNKKTKKAHELMKRNPKSDWCSRGKNFTLRIEDITEENIGSCIKDIVTMLEWDGFTLKY
jgi:hypothetical protein